MKNPEITELAEGDYMVSVEDFAHRTSENGNQMIVWKMKVTYPALWSDHVMWKNSLLTTEESKDQLKREVQRILPDVDLTGKSSKEVKELLKGKEVWITRVNDEGNWKIRIRGVNQIKDEFSF